MLRVLSLLLTLGNSSVTWLLLVRLFSRGFVLKMTFVGIPWCSCPLLFFPLLSCKYVERMAPNPPEGVRLCDFQSPHNRWVWRLIPNGLPWSINQLGFIPGQVWKTQFHTWVCIWTQSIWWGRVSSLLLPGLKNQSGVELLLSPLGSGILLNDLKKKNH